MNGINPKVSLFFWLFFPGFLFSTSLSIAVQYTVLGALFLVQAAIVFSGVILLANQFKAIFSALSLRLYFRGAVVDFGGVSCACLKGTIFEHGFDRSYRMPKRCPSRHQKMGAYRAENPLCPSLVKGGFHTLDVGSFVSSKAIPQMRDTAAVLAALDRSRKQYKVAYNCGQ